MVLIDGIDYPPRFCFCRQDAFFDCKCGCDRYEQEILDLTARVRKLEAENKFLRNAGGDAKAVRRWRSIRGRVSNAIAKSVASTASKKRFTAWCAEFAKGNLHIDPATNGYYTEYALGIGIIPVIAYPTLHPRHVHVVVPGSQVWRECLVGDAFHYTRESAEDKARLMAMDELRRCADQAEKMLPLIDNPRWS